MDAAAASADAAGGLGQGGAAAAAAAPAVASFLSPRIDAVCVGPQQRDDPWHQQITRQSKYLEGRELTMIVPKGNKDMCEYAVLKTMFDLAADKRAIERARLAYVRAVHLQHRGTGLVASCVKQLDREFNCGKQERPSRIVFDREPLAGRITAVFDELADKHATFEEAAPAAAAVGDGAAAEAADIDIAKAKLPFAL
eukprot:SAG11_NODE_5215_length_1626_cov_6.117801_2_plen_196_part_01